MLTDGRIVCSKEYSKKNYPKKGVKNKGLAGIQAEEATFDEINKKYTAFHLSYAKDPKITFTPGITDAPYFDDKGNIIEDIVTPRVSLAPTIQHALSAIANVGGGSGKEYDPNMANTRMAKNLNVYATNKKTKFFDVKGNLVNCPSSTNNPYDVDFSLDKFMDLCCKYSDEYEIRKSGNKKRRFPICKNLYSRCKGGKLTEESPSPPSFVGCVPDAKVTNELWSLEPIRMKKIGTILAHNLISKSFQKK